MMINPGTNSYSVSDSQELKYKRALKQIDKVIKANKNLKQQMQELKRQNQQKIQDLSHQLKKMTQLYQKQREQRINLDKYTQQLQDSNTVIQRQHQTAEKELSYLNQMIAQQTQQLKKLSIFKNQKNIGNIIKTYQDKQQQFISEKSILQAEIKNLNNKIQTILKQTQKDRQSKDKNQQQLSLLQSQIQKYRDLNLQIIERHQNFVKQSKSNDKIKLKQQLLTQLIKQFKQHVENLKEVQRQLSMNMLSNKNYQKNYQILIQQKTKQSVELVNLKNQYEIAHQRIQESFLIQQKLKEANAKIQQLIEQVNMLKSKIVVLETKEIVNQDLSHQYQINNQQQSHSKIVQEKISYLLAQADPLAVLKNTQDSSHFKILSAFVFQLRDKLNKSYTQNRQLSQKYKTLHSKYQKIYNSSSQNDYDVKILRGKIEGYQRLTSKLQGQLERTIKINQIQINRLKKTQIKATQIKENQLYNEYEMMKSQTHENQLKSQFNQKINTEIYTLKRQIMSKKITIQDQQARIKELNNFLDIYKQKYQLIILENQKVDKENIELHKNFITVKQQNKELSLQVDTLTLQKDELLGKVQQLAYKNNLNWNSYQVQTSTKAHALEKQVALLKSQNFALQQKGQSFNKNKLNNSQDILKLKEDHKYQIEKLNRQIQYYKQFEKQAIEAQKKLNQTERDYQIAKLKGGKYNEQKIKSSELQEMIMNKNEQISKLKRKLIDYQMKIENSENEKDRLQFDNRQLKKHLTSNYQGQKSPNNLNNYKMIEISKNLQEEKRKSEVFERQLNNERNRNLILQEQLSLQRSKVFALQNELNRLQNKNDSYRNVTNYKISSNIIQNKNDNGIYGKIISAQPNYFHNNRYQLNNLNLQNKDLNAHPSLKERKSYDYDLPNQNLAQIYKSVQYSPQNNNQQPIVNTVNSFQTKSFQGYPVNTITSVGYQDYQQFNDNQYQNKNHENYSKKVPSVQIIQQKDQNNKKIQYNQNLSYQPKSYASFEQYKASFKFIKPGSNKNIFDNKE